MSAGTRTALPLHEVRPGDGTHRPRPQIVPGRRPPGRPRSEQASQAIIGATLEMLVEGVSVDALSMEAVAARAGVGKATLYRRWPNKSALIHDALASLYEPPVPVSRGSVRQDLTAMVADLRRWARDSTAGRLLPHFAGGGCRSAELQAQYVRSVIEPRKAAFREIMRRGAANGDLHPDVDLEATIMVVFGSVLFQFVLDAETAEDQFSADHIVDLILPGISAVSPPR